MGAGRILRLCHSAVGDPAGAVRHPCSYDYREYITAVFLRSLAEISRQHRGGTSAQLDSARADAAGIQGGWLARAVALPSPGAVLDSLGPPAPARVAATKRNRIGRSAVPRNSRALLCPGIRPAGVFDEHALRFSKVARCGMPSCCLSPRPLSELRAIPISYSRARMPRLSTPLSANSTTGYSAAMESTPAFFRALMFPAPLRLPLR
jgi:hypothetical protein